MGMIVQLSYKIVRVLRWFWWVPTLNKFVQLGLNFRGNAFSVFPLRFIPSFSSNILSLSIPPSPLLIHFSEISGR